ncbi:hypothetical protein THRCLA_05898 [Thraustotheca clavata]|uniref:Uncharacterized protein n=1 Tax=Thraustotheca clavata TaxID=74557 RepID=A0A1V9ZSD5_9STRA|nr:hypothetical protein THRCLA_05898 [Thraustotheca clavata]
MELRKEKNFTTVGPTGLKSLLTTGLWNRIVKSESGIPLQDVLKEKEDFLQSPSETKHCVEESHAETLSSVSCATPLSKEETIEDFSTLSIENNTTLPCNDETIARLTKQNQFLVLLLRKVTGKVMQNRVDLTVQRHRIQDLEREHHAKTLRFEQTTQTAMGMGMAHLDALCEKDEEIESLSWQLKIANAKVSSLSKCLQTERQDNDTKLQNQALTIFQLEQQLNQLPNDSPSSSSENAYTKQLEAVVAHHVHETIKVEKRRFIDKEGRMDLGLLKMHLKSATFARSNKAPTTSTAKALQELDHLQAHLAARIQSHRDSLAQIDPIDADT